MLNSFYVIHSLFLRNENIFRKRGKIQKKLREKKYIFVLNKVNHFL